MPARLYRLIALLLLASLQLIPANAFWHGSVASLSNNGGMLMGLGGQCYFCNGPMLLNWAQVNGGSFGVALVAGGNETISQAVANGHMDTNGALIAGSGLSAVSSISYGLFTPSVFAPVVPGLSAWWSGLQMKVTWTGTSSPTLTGSLGTGSTALSCGANSCTFTFGSNPNNVGITFPVSNTASPPSNVFVYEAQYQTQVTALSSCIAGVNCNHFDPAWLANIKSFGRLRTMDIMSVNNGGPVDTSQMADFSYQICVFCAYGGEASAQSGNASISGITLTVTALDFPAATFIGVNASVNCTGCTAGTVITGSAEINPGQCSPSCTGTGGNGTYAVNHSQTVSSQPIYFAPVVGSFVSDLSGPKGGMHPSVAVELAQVTGADIHYNLPVGITDTGMTNVATYFRDHMPAGTKVIFEIGNENWNPSLGITYYWMNAASSTSVIGGTQNGTTYQGYRMGQLMAIVQGVYGTNSYNTRTNPTGKWMGVVGGQFALNSAAATSFITGFNTWQSGCSCTTKVADLFGEVVIAPYFSDFPNSQQVTSVTPGSTTTISCSSGNCGVASGQRVRLSFNTTSAGTVGSVLNGQYVTASASSGSSFSFTSINTTGLTYSTGSANDYVASDGNDVKPLYDTALASTACAASSTATATGTLAGTALTLSGITGTPTIGQPITGSGVPANTFLVNGSGTAWTTNNSGSFSSVSLTFSPCTTAFQYFAYETSKALITGSAGDLGYLPSQPQTGFPAAFAQFALIFNAYGMEVSEYEGGNQFVAGGQMAVAGQPGNILGMTVNWQWDAAGNDPNYTPAKVYQNQFQMLRNVQSAWSAKYVDQQYGGVFSGVRYFGDINPGWSAILAENALGPYQRPAPISPTATYPGNSTNKFPTSSGSSSSCGGNNCTDTITGVVIGTAAVTMKVVAEFNNQPSGNPTITCDGIPNSTPEVVLNSNGYSAIYHFSLSAGANSRNCTMASNGTQFFSRVYYFVTLSGLQSSTPITTSTLSTSHTISVNYSKNGAIILTGSGGNNCGTGYSATTGVSPTGAAATTTTKFSDLDVPNLASMAAFSWPYVNPGFVVDTGSSCNNGVAAVYGWLLKRDLDTA